MTRYRISGRMQRLIRMLTNEAPGIYRPPTPRQACVSPYARWVNGMSEETFVRYVSEEIERLKSRMEWKPVQLGMFTQKEIDNG